MKKITFIDPRGLVKGLNTGLGYLSAVLIDKGFEVTVIDLNNKYGNELKRLESINDSDVVGISVKSFTYEDSIRLANLVKKINKNAVLIAGGPHITLDAINFLKENKQFDIAVLGEGEKSIIDIMSDKPLEKIEGIAFHSDSNVKFNRMGKWIEELDSLSFPDYTRFDSVYDYIKIYPIVTSRGCPYSCTYCSVGNVIGKKWRSRSPKNIIKELEHAKEKYKSAEFKILDDNFTLDINRAKDICRLIIDKKLDMRWSCPNGIRADRVDNELLKLMKESGCYSISIGVESCIPYVFDALKKGETLDDVRNAIKMAKNIGIRVEGFFILGLPGSNYESDMKSVDIAKKMRLDAASWGILVPYPGTEIWEWVNKPENAHILGDWKKGFHIGLRPKPVFETKDYSAKQMRRAFYMANIKTVGLKRIVKNVIRSIFKR